ncbi:MAG: diphthine--ammonia ligase [Thermoplasmatales archaeon]
MKAIALLSGGKDSFLSINIALMLGIEMEATITVVPSQDSMMFHHPNAHLGSVISNCLGIRNITVEEDEFEDAVSKFPKKLLVAGAIESDYQKSRLEEMCEKYGLTPFFPLWRKNNESLLLEFISTGSSGIFTSVAAEGLDETLLGREINEESLEILRIAKKRHRISLVGEGGEYETLVISSPFENCFIKIERTSVVDRGIQKNLLVEEYTVVTPSGNEKRQTGLSI